MIQVTVGECDQMTDPGDRMADRAEYKLRIAKTGLTGGGECREQQGCTQIHA